MILYQQIMMLYVTFPQHELVNTTRFVSKKTKLIAKPTVKHLHGNLDGALPCFRRDLHVLAGVRQVGHRLASVQQVVASGTKPPTQPLFLVEKNTHGCLLRDC